MEVSMLEERLLDSDSNITAQDLLTEIESPYYKSNKYYEVRGAKLVVKEYENFIHRGFKREVLESTKDKCSLELSNLNDNNINNEVNVTNTNSSWSDLSSEECQKQNDMRSSRRRSRQIRGIIDCNINELNKFMTLTMGCIDYKSLIEGLMSKKEDGSLEKDVFSKQELESLCSIKRIQNIEGYLKTKVRNTLGKKLKKFDYVQNKSEGATKGQIRRAVDKELNALICETNPYSIDDTNRLFDNFRDRLRREFGDDFSFKYIIVVEFQDNGKVHFHVLCNLPFIDQGDLQLKWGNGKVDIQQVDDKKKIGNYLVKSMKTSSQNPKIKGNQLYRTSQGLKRPQEVTREDEIEILEEFIADKTPVYTKEFKAESKFGKSYRMKIYELESNHLYNMISYYRNYTVKSLIDYAKQKKIDSIDKKLIWSARQRYLENLKYGIEKLQNQGLFRNIDLKKIA